jgi:hypothetical protein
MEYLYVFLLYFIGIFLLGFPGWVASQVNSRTTDRTHAFKVSVVVGVVVAVFLHLLISWFSGFDPVDPEEVANGTADLYRLGGYGYLGWYPLAAALFGLALSLIATRRRSAP